MARWWKNARLSPNTSPHFITMLRCRFARISKELYLCQPTNQIFFRTVALCEKRCSFTRWPNNCETSSAVPLLSSFVLRIKTSLKKGGSERHSSRASEVETVRLACIYRLLKLTTTRSVSYTHL